MNKETQAPVSIIPLFEELLFGKGVLNRFADLSSKDSLHSQFLAMAKLDTEEQHFHIESLEPTEVYVSDKLKRIDTRVWPITEWKNSYARELIKREASARERKASNIKNEIIEKIATAMARHIKHNNNKFTLPIAASLYDTIAQGNEVPSEMVALFAAFKIDYKAILAEVVEDNEAEQQ